MAITFPASPSDGDVFTNSTTGVKYIYNATDGVWKTHVWPTNTDYLQLSGGTLTGDLSLGTNDLTAQDITTTGSVTVGNGLTVSDGNVVMASGHGIDFSATADGSGTTSSELLDDYEEGTWTPGVKVGTISSTSVGTYIKVGRLCTVTAYCLNFSDRTSTDAVEITGLPYAAQASDATTGAVMVRYLNNANGSNALTSPVGYLATGDTSLRVYQQSAQGDVNYDALKHEDILNGSTSIRWNLTYITT